MAALAALAVGAWIWSRLGSAPELLFIGAPLAVAVVIGSSAASPLAELESTLGRRLPSLRLMHLGGMLLLAALTLFLADHTWILCRNAAGFTGLALISTRFLGAGIAWLVPFAYGALAILSDPGADWNWPRQATGHGPATILALVLAMAGLATITRHGAYHSVGEDN